MLTHFNKKNSKEKGLAQHHFFRKKSGAGFSFVEIIIVIGIIGIISSIVYTNYRSSDDKRAIEIEAQNIQLKLRELQFKAFTGEESGVGSGIFGDFGVYYTTDDPNKLTFFIDDGDDVGSVGQFIRGDDTLIEDYEISGPVTINRAIRSNSTGGLDCTFPNVDLHYFSSIYKRPDVKPAISATDINGDSALSTYISIFLQIPDGEERRITMWDTGEISIGDISDPGGIGGETCGDGCIVLDDPDDTGPIQVEGCDDGEIDGGTYNDYCLIESELKHIDGTVNEQIVSPQPGFCVEARCGDGYKCTDPDCARSSNLSGPEACDDANGDNTDKCDTGWDSVLGQLDASLLAPNSNGFCELTFCGDGVIQNPNGASDTTFGGTAEVCDDMDTSDIRFNGTTDLGYRAEDIDYNHNILGSCIIDKVGSPYPAACWDAATFDSFLIWASNDYDSNCGNGYLELDYESYGSLEQCDEWGTFNYSSDRCNDSGPSPTCTLQQCNFGSSIESLGSPVRNDPIYSSNSKSQYDYLFIVNDGVEDQLYDLAGRISFPSSGQPTFVIYRYKKETSQINDWEKVTTIPLDLCGTYGGNDSGPVAVFGGYAYFGVSANTSRSVHFFRWAPGMANPENLGVVVSNIQTACPGIQTRSAASPKVMAIEEYDGDIYLLIDNDAIVRNEPPQLIKWREGEGFTEIDTSSFPTDGSFAQGNDLKTFNDGSGEKLYITISDDINNDPNYAKIWTYNGINLEEDFAVCISCDRSQRMSSFTIFENELYALADLTGINNNHIYKKGSGGWVYHSQLFPASLNDDRNKLYSWDLNGNEKLFAGYQNELFRYEAGTGWISIGIYPWGQNLEGTISLIAFDADDGGGERLHISQGDQSTAQSDVHRYGFSCSACDLLPGGLPDCSWITQCSDGADNDGDDLVDFGDDPECTSVSDDDESS